MNYELDISLAIKRLEEQIILKQRNVEVMNINLQENVQSDDGVALSHAMKIAEIGAIEAMKKERDKLLKMSKGK